MNLILLGVAALTIAGNPAEVSRATQPSEGDRHALERLAAENDAAWGAKDVAIISGQYATEGTVRVSPQSPVITGRSTVTDFFKNAFDRRQGTHRHITKLDHIELVAPDLALADGDVRVERQEADGSWRLVRTFRSVTLAVRQDGGWKLRSVRAIPMN